MSETQRRNAPQRARPLPIAALSRQPWPALSRLLPETAPRDSIERLQQFAELLLDWNRGVSNLISRNDEARLVERHFAESLAGAREIAAAGSQRLIDFGSGGGFPAVPLALCGVGREWTLVESRRNKTLFLRKVQQEMKLGHFDVVTARLEQAVEDGDLGSFDGFTSRATTLLAPTLELAARLVRSGGMAFLWKGSSYNEELDRVEPSMGRAWRFDHATVIGDGPGVIAVFERAAD